LMNFKRKVSQKYSNNDDRKMITSQWCECYVLQMWKKPRHFRKLSYMAIGATLCSLNI